jgi:molybdopterin-biosynthesis enzyme MoeA-like protein
MAWPMIEATLDAEFSGEFNLDVQAERSLLVYDTAESALVPVMERVEQDFDRVKTFSLPSIGDGHDGRPKRRHIELGVKGPAALVDPAFELLRSQVEGIGAEFSIA